MRPLVHHAKRERRVGSRTNHKRFVGLHRSFGAAHIDRHNVGAATLSGHEVAGCIRLAREVCALQQDQ